MDLEEIKDPHDDLHLSNARLKTYLYCLEISGYTLIVW